MTTDNAEQLLNRTQRTAHRIALADSARNRALEPSFPLHEFVEFCHVCFSLERVEAREREIASDAA